MTTQRTKVGEIAGNHFQLQESFMNLLHNLPVEDAALYQLLLFRYYEDDPAAAERRGLIANAKQCLDKLDPPATPAEMLSLK